IDRLDAFYGMHFRPQAVSGWLREIFPHWQIVNITRPGAGAFDSRFIDYHLPFTLQNSTFIETGVNANVEVLTDDFTINSARHIVVPPGRYEYNEYFILATTDRGKRVSFIARYGAGPFHDGSKESSTFGGQVRASARLTAGVNWSRNVVDLRNGAYTTD